jgi:hypothetical protein
MNSEHQKKISNIVFSFNRQVSKITKVAKQIDPNDVNVEWIQRAVRVLRAESPLLILEKCMDKLWDNRAKIIACDRNFFVKTGNFSKYIKNDENKQWLEGVVEMVRRKQSVLTEKQLQLIWECLNQMLHYVIQYRIVTGDYST